MTEPHTDLLMIRQAQKQRETASPTAIEVSVQVRLNNCSDEYLFFCKCLIVSSTVLITHLAAAESRCAKLDRQLDHMRRMLHNVKADRTSMLKEQVRFNCMHEYFRLLSSSKEIL